MESNETPDARDDRARLVANERAKLTATFLNGVAIAMVAVGGLAPLTAALISDAAFTSRALAAILITFVAAYGMHLLARRLLGALTT